MRVSRWVVAAAVGSTVVLASCSDSADDPVTTSDDAATTSPSVDDGGGSTEDVAATSAPVVAQELAPVPCEGAPREPSDLEDQLLVEAGPFAGDSFDAVAAADAVVAQDPSTDEEWKDAIFTQIQGDYAATVCEVMKFSPDLGGPEEGPEGEEAADESVGQNHFALVLDASGSMAAQAGSGTQMDEAKRAIESFTAELPDAATVSLRIYGHEGDNTEAGKAESCESSEVIFQGAPSDPELQAAINSVEAVGFTPLGKAIGDAEGDIPQEATDAVMYVVSDGLETCGGDPVAAAEGVAAAGVNPIINVIGFRVDSADQDALRAIAEAGGGQFTTADSEAELTAYWAEERERLRVAWRDWRDAEVERLQGAVDDKRAEIQASISGLSDARRDEAESIYAIMSELQGRDSFDSSDSRNNIQDLAINRTAEVQGYMGEAQDLSREISDNYMAGFSDVYSQASTRWTDAYRENNER